MHVKSKLNSNISAMKNFDEEIYEASRRTKKSREPAA